MEKEKIKLLIVEDDQASIDLYKKLLLMAKRSEFEVTCAYDFTKTIKLINNNSFDLILLDLNLPDSSGFDTFLKIKEYSSDIPIIILSGSGDSSIAVKAVKEGAQDYITKGQVEFSMFLRSIDYSIERDRIKKKLQDSKNDLEVKVNERTFELQLEKKKLHRILLESIDAFAFALEKRDAYTAGHQRRVAQLSMAIGLEKGLSEDKLKGLYLASLVHDIGKIGVPTEILVKPTKLNENEMNIVRMHSDTGHGILKDIEFPWPIAQIVRQHHENINGSGYPDLLTSEKILLESKILRVADTVEAMLSHRPYRPAIGVEGALKELNINKGDFYDAIIVEICLDLFIKKNFIFK